MGHKHKQKTKQQSSKPTEAAASKPTAKGKRKKQTSSSWNADSLPAQLAALGLRVKEVSGDGNCLFRAVSDQLEGHEGLHAELRQRCVDYIREHPDDFQPFVEDDEPFVKYCNRMEKEGTWGGHLELQAVSLVEGVNVAIHQPGMPCWTLHNHKQVGCRLIHIAYHGGEHYNSVRNADDYSKGRPEPIAIKAGGSAGSHDELSEVDIERVAAASATGNLALARRLLMECAGNVDEAIERIVEISVEEQFAGSVSTASPHNGTTEPLPLDAPPASCTSVEGGAADGLQGRTSNTPEPSNLRPSQHCPVASGVTPIATTPTAATPTATTPTGTTPTGTTPAVTMDVSHSLNSTLVHSSLANGTDDRQAGQISNQAGQTDVENGQTNSETGRQRYTSVPSTADGVHLRQSLTTTSDQGAEHVASKRNHSSAAGDSRMSCGKSALQSLHHAPENGISQAHEEHSHKQICGGSVHCSALEEGTGVHCSTLEEERGVHVPSGTSGVDCTATGGHLSPAERTQEPPRSTADSLLDSAGVADTPFAGGNKKECLSDQQGGMKPENCAPPAVVPDSLTVAVPVANGTSASGTAYHSRDGSPDPSTVPGVSSTRSASDGSGTKVVSTDSNRAKGGKKAKASKGHVAVKSATVQHVKVPRNKSCPCRSGKKYKNCCGAAHAVQKPRAAETPATNDQSSISKTLEVLYI